MKLVKYIIALAGMVLLPLGACGGSDDADEPEPQPGVTDGPAVPDGWRPADGLALIADPLTPGMWFSTGTLRTTSAVMQCFDIDFDKNLIYYSQLNNKYRLYISWSEPNATQYQGVMQLHYFGHGGNFTIEKAGNDRYLWIGNYASKNSKDEYWGSQVVSRVPVKADAVVKPWDCTDNYYFGELNISVAVDFEHDRLSIVGVTSGIVRTYSLSALQALPVETIELEPVKFGGGVAPDVEQIVTPKVRARDCTKVRPLGQFKIVRQEGVSWQGFDVCGDIIYQMQGNGNENDGLSQSNGYLLVFGIDGTEVLPRTRVGALADLGKLSDMGITDTGYMEPEGVKVRNGALYCGFASKNSANVRRGTIFKYSAVQAKSME